MSFKFTYPIYISYLHWCKLNKMSFKFPYPINSYEKWVTAYVQARHFELIFPFIVLHILSFSLFEVTGNWVNTKVFKEFSLVLSRGVLLCVPSVLLFASSCLVKKYGNSFIAHLWGSFSCCSTSCTPRFFLGLTQLLIISSSTLIWVLGEGCCSVGVCTCTTAEQDELDSSPHGVALNALVSVVERLLLALSRVRGKL